VKLLVREGELGQLEIRLPAGRAFTERETHILSAFADAVSSHVMTARLLSRRVHEATHDGLTGLANRTLLLRRCEAALDQRADGELVALLLLDLDRFKQVNDTLGHAAGDTLLQQVAGRLTGQVRREDLVARLGGDEFGVLLTGIESAADAESVAEALIGVLHEPFLLEGLRVSVGGSVGVAVCPLDADNVEGLLRNADLAMYEAKVRPGSASRYRGERDRGSADRLVVLTELQSAVDQSVGDAKLMLYYQPKVTLGTGRTVGYEALVRWQHPRRGLLWPTHIVPVVEQSPLVRDFTLRVLDMACAAAGQLARHDPIEPPTMAVNLSARNLMDARLIDDVMEILDRNRLEPQRLILEITETVIVSELEVVEQVLSGLRSRGVQLSVDDFGTGFSSLAFLQRFAVNEIKVDRRFVQDIATNPGDAAIVRSTVHLASGLGVRVVAEGVETEEQVQRLREYGCDLGQGYLLGHPVPLAQLLRPAQV
jgi:diguanylate cyclase (GGDEF)-like protein